MKKKAIKIAAASAVAASAFVAAAPLESNAASNVGTTVDNAVKQMQVAYHTYSDVTATGQFADINAVNKAYNAAKAAYTSAKAAVVKAGGAQKDAYLAKLDSNYKELISKRVVTYIDAYNYAVNNLEANKTALQKAIDAKDLAGVQKSYNEISYQLKVRTVILDRVYGKSTRDLLKSSFKADAQDLRDTMQYDVTVAAKAKAVTDAVAAGKLDVAAAAVAQINTFLPKVSDTFKAELTTAAKAAVAAYEAKLTPTIESVSAINAKQLVVKFNKAVDPSTVITPLVSAPTDVNNGTLKSVFTVNGSALTGDAALSTDGKSLTITITGNTNGNYMFGYADSGSVIRSTNGTELGSFYQALNAKDTTAPTNVSTTTVDATHATVDFSEPIASPGNLKATLADGTDVTSYVTATGVTGNSINVDLTNANLVTGKAITLTFTGVIDYAGNLVSPNPVSVVVTKGAADGVAPYVASVTPVNAVKFDVKFSEQVQGFTNTDVSVTGGAVVTDVTKDSTDKTLYHVTLSAPVQGLQTVTVLGQVAGPAAAYLDLSGQAPSTTAFTRIVNFATDSTNPTASAVVTKDSNGVEVLKFTTSEDTTKFQTTGTVTLTNAKKVYNYVTTTGALTFAASALTPVTGTTNQYTVPLSLVQFSGADLVTGASYTADVPANLFADTAGLNNLVQTGVVTITRGTDSDTTKPTVDTVYDTSSVETAANTTHLNGVYVVNSTTLKVHFTGSLDGASATNKLNYSVSGATVSNVSLDSSNVVTLTLANESNNNSGLRGITISGVKNSSGVAMNTFTTTDFLTENYRPTISSVAVTSLTGGNSVITLTASEVLALGATNAQDFDLYIGGTQVTTGFTSIATSGTGNQVVVTITGKQLTATDFANGVELRPESTVDITDVAGNALNVPNGKIAVTLN